MPKQSRTLSSASPASAQLVEIELKLALWPEDAARIGALPLLKRRTPQWLKLHNIYFDTPDQQLCQRGAALRLRRDGRHWLQTLKTVGDATGALSARGEWEQPVKVHAEDPRLDAQALAASAWPQMDPDGQLFAALSPQFTTEFTRTLWTVCRTNKSVVEVALDIGHARAGERSAPIAELELELKRGTPADLFEVAAQLAAHIALLPSAVSKAQRGYALAQGTGDAPVMAQTPSLSGALSLAAAARQVLGLALTQFCGNLITLRHADDAELVHQARVGWRRFKSALKLFGPALGNDAPPATPALRALLVPLARLRDLDVAALEVLPRWQAVYVQRSAHRKAQWNNLQDALYESRLAARGAVRHALRHPAVGASLIALTQWLETLPAPVAEPTALDEFATARLQRLRKRMQRALAQADDLEAQHQARILAKRIRYGVEALERVLSKEKARRWRREATAVQSQLGSNRDTAQVAALTHVLGAAPELEAFLRGVAAGQNSIADHSTS
jgi:inorganic triphosphatase YgiF